MIVDAILPFNERGAVYHLDLLPEEIADVIITVGDPNRVGEISKHFDTIDLERSHREFVTHTGTIGNKRLSVLSTGIGVPNIDIVMNELDALVNIDFKTREIKNTTKSLSIIRLGTTGGLQAECVPGDIVVTEYALGFDNLLKYYQHELSADAAIIRDNILSDSSWSEFDCYVTEADKKLVGIFQDLGQVGITATCGGFYGPQGRKLRIPLAYPEMLDVLSAFAYNSKKILNFEMETSGILGLGKLLGHKCLSVSVVLANRKNGHFAEDINHKVDKLIEVSLNKILELA